MTTSDQSALLAAILADPTQDTPRLAYADWCDENGQPDRAEFIRVQVELARWSGCVYPKLGLSACNEYNHPGVKVEVWCTECQREKALRARERELLDPVADHKPGQWGKPSWEWFAQYFAGWAEPYATSRGFVSQITCTSADWLRHADALYWRPGATTECPECRGFGGEDKYDPDDPGNQLMHGPHWYACQDCNGTGRIPRPVPPVAQPLERVVLTTDPEFSQPWVRDEGRQFGYHIAGETVWVDQCDLEIHSDLRDRAATVLARRWPGIVFEMRPRQETLFRGVPIVWADNLFGGGQ